MECFWRTPNAAIEDTTFGANKNLCTESSPSRLDLSPIGSRDFSRPNAATEALFDLVLCSTSCFVEAGLLARRCESITPAGNRREEDERALSNKILAP